jgi:hypothetical protein
MLLNESETNFSSHPEIALEKNIASQQHTTTLNPGEKNGYHN